MRSTHYHLAFAAAFAVGLLAFLPAAPAQALTAYGTTGDSRLITFDTSSPGTIASNTPITGLPGSPTHLYDVDLRPVTAGLYGVAVRSFISPGDPPQDFFSLQSINPTTAVATQIGSEYSGSGVGKGFDFDPKSDEARLVNDSRINLRINPTTGVASTDSTLSQTGITAIAYDRNVIGSTATTLFGIDYINDKLVRIGGVDGSPSPNGGQVTAIGPLGPNASNAVAMDVTPDGTAYAAIRIGAEGFSRLHTIDLNTGAATEVGRIGATNLITTGLAIQPPTFVAPPSSQVGSGSISGGSAARDRRSPSVQVALARRLKLSKILRQGGFTFRFSCDEACSSSALLTPTGQSSANTSANASATLGKGAAGLIKAGSGSLGVRLTKAGRRSLKRLRKSKRRQKSLSLSVTTSDPAGNRSTTSRVVAIRR